MTPPIPKIVHQTWKTSDVPPRLRQWSDTWKGTLPDWEYRLWTDASARELVVRKFPHLLRKYDSYPFNIQRVDVARMLFLIEYGGLYVDMDFEALRPIDELLDCSTVLACESRVDSQRAGRPLLVSNAIMASEPGAPFLLHALRCLPAGWPPASVIETVLNTTGPYFLTRAYQSFSGPVKLIEDRVFFSIDLEASRLPIDREKLAASGAYAIHHFASSWWPAAAPRNAEFAGT
jgi:mannosyltransferase OCH1-like enzyme